MHSCRQSLVRWCLGLSLMAIAACQSDGRPPEPLAATEGVVKPGQKILVVGTPDLLVQGKPTFGSGEAVSQALADALQAQGAAVTLVTQRLDHPAAWAQARQGGYDYFASARIIEWVDNPARFSSPHDYLRLQVGLYDARSGRALLVDQLYRRRSGPVSTGTPAGLLPAAMADFADQAF